ncbi:DUF4296 domain-containing protein [Maribacter sp. 2210JD10-5]|uniref:DUF4296 domain-containing protein n=1 Tax=Maribacter sp. 2210JD10-5 TaxID=3386272 RepID=UPI0039BCFFF0
MIKKQLIAVGLLLFLLACGEKLIDTPENLIPKDEMVLILKDMAILNAAKGINLGKLKEYGIDPTNHVFEKYGIDSAQFVESDRYYASLPEDYEALYIEVETLLEKEKEILDEAKKLVDSLERNKMKSAEKDKSKMPLKTTDVAQ